MVLLLVVLPVRAESNAAAAAPVPIYVVGFANWSKSHGIACLSATLYIPLLALRSGLAAIIANLLTELCACSRQTMLHVWHTIPFRALALPRLALRAKQARSATYK
jgi:hypothetical protein